MIELEPQPRIDTLVRVPGVGDARRTEYTGRVWFDGKPEVAGPILRRPASAPRGIRTPSIQTSFFVPDSLPYLRAAVTGATLSVGVALCGSGESGAITAAHAVFADDPSGEPAWIQLVLHAHLSWPAGVSYRVVALTAPDAVRELRST